MTDLAFLDKIKVADCEFSGRVEGVIRRAYGADATLGDIVRGGGADALLKQRNFGRRSAQEVRDILDYATARPPEIEALLVEKTEVVATDMTLRDWFAGQALAGILSRGIHYEPERLGLSAYEAADIMLAARNGDPAMTNDELRARRADERVADDERHTEHNRRATLFPELVEALEEIADAREPMMHDPHKDRCIHRRGPEVECVHCVRGFARAVLAKAKGEAP